MELTNHSHPTSVLLRENATNLCIHIYVCICMYIHTWHMTGANNSATTWNSYKCIYTCICMYICIYLHPWRHQQLSCNLKIPCVSAQVCVSWSDCLYISSLFIFYIYIRERHQQLSLTDVYIYKYTCICMYIYIYRSFTL